MSFFGKQFKKVKVDNGPEFIEKTTLPQQILSMLQQKESVTTFTKNPDGTLHYVVKAAGKVVLEQQIVLDKEFDVTAPDGKITKIFYSLQGDEMKSYIKLPNGTTVHLNRTFDAKGMKLELYVDGNSPKATVHYEAL